MDFEVLGMGEVILHLVDDIFFGFAFDGSNTRDRLEVGESDFEKLRDGLKSLMRV